MIGGVLVERNVKEVLPALETNLTGVSDKTGGRSLDLALIKCSLKQLRAVMESLAKQYKTKDEEVQKLQADARR
jgi:hypothetical protein